jgi:hypothetical protein
MKNTADYKARIVSPTNYGTSSPSPANRGNGGINFFKSYQNYSSTKKDVINVARLLDSSKKGIPWENQLPSRGPFQSPLDQSSKQSIED